MDKESFEYTQFPDPQSKGKPAKARAVSAPAGVAAAAVVVASFFAAGTLLFPKVRPAAPPKAEPEAPAAEEPTPDSAPGAAAEAPVLEKNAASPLPLPIDRGPAGGVQAVPAGEMGAVIDHGGRAMPAWALVKIAQKWVWPKSVGEGRMRSSMLHQSRAAGHSSFEANAAVSRRLAGWFPDNPAGQRVQYATKGADGREQLMYEFDPEAVAANQRGLVPNQPGLMRNLAGTPVNIEEIRAVELANLQRAKGSVSSRDVRRGPNGVPLAELTYADGHKEVIPYDPLVFDLKGNGVKTDSRKVLFDLYGHGKADKLQWMSNLDPDVGILVFDANGSGRSGKNGSEVFGDRTDLSGVGRPDGFVDGFAALRALVKKAVAEQVLSQDAVASGVLEADSLSALEKAYGLRLKIGGFNSKTVSLAEGGVAAIALSDAKTQRIANFDGRSNDLVVQPGAVYLRRDGKTGSYMNVWLKANDGAPGLTQTQALIR